MNQVAVYESKKTRLERIKGYCQNKYAALGAAATVTAMSVGSAHADTLDVTPLTDGLTSVTSNSKLIFGGALLILGLFVAWRYTKRGANSA